MKNFKHITGSFYLVRTQAGFKQSLKHFDEGETKWSNIKGALNSFPKKYPCITSYYYDFDRNMIDVQTASVKSLVKMLAKKDLT